MPGGYSGNSSRMQCKIQLSWDNFGGAKGHRECTFKEPTIRNFGNRGEYVSGYAGIITNLPFLGTQRMERMLP